MSAPKTLTAKGSRSATRVLRAATTVLARDGFAGATLSRIAEEAGTDKRTILYYYGTREALLVRVVQTVGERIAENSGALITPSRGPEELADAAVESLWSGVTSIPEVSRAYFALIGGGAGPPLVEEALRDLKYAFLDAIVRQVESIDGSRWKLRRDPASVARFILAALRGLLLEWHEDGEGDELRAGLELLKRAIAAEFVPTSPA
ncbi:MAG: TetR/AcrR family transcriptional regulator [Solirubrobacterales bacterium]